MGLTVLIIDESASTTDFFGGTLRAQGMDVTFCHSGAEGLELARSISFDFILLELFSPGSDGWESCKKLRAQTTAPIVVLSALNDPLLVTSALDAGADDYLTRPVPSRVLLAHIRNLTRRHQVETNRSSMLRQVNSANQANIHPDSR